MSKKSRPMLQTTLASTLAQSIEVSITFPFEFLKCELQLAAQEQRKLTLMECIAQTKRDFGFKGFYRGLQVWLVGAPLRGFLKFSAYDIIANRILRQRLNFNQKSASSIGGFFAGVAEATFVTTPMLSVQVKMADDSRAGSAQYRGLARSVGLVYKNYGLIGFTDGMLTTVLKGGVNNLIRFGTFYTWKMYMADQEGNLSVKKSFQGGALAGFISVFVTQPIDTVKSCMQGLERGQFRSSLHCTQSILANHGFVGLYQGIQARFFRVVMEQSIMFGLFEEVCKVLDPVFEVD